MATQTKVAGTVVSAGSWTNFTTARLASQDGSSATMSGNSYVVGVLRNFGFTLPANATVTGIELGAAHGANNNSATSYIRFRISKDAGANYTEYTEPLDVRGTTITKQSTDAIEFLADYAEINDNTNFYIEVGGASSAANRGVVLDLIDITVHYTTPLSAAVNAVTLAAEAVFIVPTITAEAEVVANIQAATLILTAVFGLPTITATSSAAVEPTPFGLVAEFGVPTISAVQSVTVQSVTFEAVVLFQVPSVTVITGAVNALINTPALATVAVFSEPAITAEVSALITVPTLATVAGFESPGITSTSNPVVQVPTMQMLAAFSVPVVQASGEMIVNAATLAMIIRFMAPRVTGFDRKLWVGSRISVKVRFGGTN